MSAMDSQQETYPNGWSPEDDHRSAKYLRERELKRALEELHEERFVTEQLTARLDAVEDAVRYQRRRWWDLRATRTLWRLVSKR